MARFAREFHCRGSPHSVRRRVREGLLLACGILPRRPWKKRIVDPAMPYRSPRLHQSEELLAIVQPSTPTVVPKPNTWHMSPQHLPDLDRANSQKRNLSE